ncbi:MFS transporter [Lentibacter algarum]|uniref:MFS transporter n=1 Tax=Lentibacter algarum TaxID=576131 RepID=UPI001C076285|nr:MFS transporter [Lentibacter algarum]MBU2980347.1 MFS transporter [Lentibacter algarum]
MSTIAFLKSNLRWLLAGALLTFMSSFGQTFFISVFAGEIRAEFGLSHGEWGGIYALGTLASALVMVWAGGLTDHYRVRTLGPVILVLLASACIFMASLSALWLLPVVIFSLRITGQGMTNHIAVVAMARWFTATRGRALSIASLGVSVGQALLPLLFVFLLTVYDWRILWVVSALAVLAGIPILTGLLRQERTPQSIAHSSQSLGMNARQWTRNQAVKHRLFWCMVPTLLGPAAWGTALMFHQVHYSEIKGIAHVTFVAMFPVYTAATIISMLLTGWALDRIGTARLIPFMHLPAVLAFVVFALAGGPWGLLLGFVLFGMSSGAHSTLPSAFWAEFYGTAHIGSIKALAAAIMVLGSAIGPGITGWGIDAGIGLETQYLAVALYFIGSSLLMWIGVRRAAVDLPELVKTAHDH